MTRHCLFFTALSSIALNNDSRDFSPPFFIFLSAIHSPSEQCFSTGAVGLGVPFGGPPNFFQLKKSQTFLSLNFRWKRFFLMFDGPPLRFMGFQASDVEKYSWKIVLHPISYKNWRINGFVSSKIAILQIEFLFWSHFWSKQFFSGRDVFSKNVADGLN